MTLDDQELARVTEDTGSVTMSGCVAVCGDFEVSQNHPVADGARPDAAPGVGWPASRCALSGHELTCFWHLCAL